jgi:hypothetical protein
MKITTNDERPPQKRFGPKRRRIKVVDGGRLSQTKTKSERIRQAVKYLDCRNVCTVCMFVGDAQKSPMASETSLAASLQALSSKLCSCDTTDNSKMASSMDVDPPVGKKPIEFHPVSQNISNLQYS